MSLLVISAGVLSLVQDSGRFGAQRLGLTQGGPLDDEAFTTCNRLLQNDTGAAAVEISVGGLKLQAGIDTWVCLTGAEMPLTINGEERDSWSVHPVRAGDEISLGYAQRGTRAYLGVAGGFSVPHYLGSCATVLREQVGGLDGSALKSGDLLPCVCVDRRKLLQLPPSARPRYSNQLTVRVIPGYQQRHFSRVEQRRFFGVPYTVSERSDRMGYRLEGPAVTCDVDGILSEGICAGAIQIPPDGQPIVLLNDRQTIGGYPKIGAALSLDRARLAQMPPGGTVHFAAITPHTARRALTLAQRFGHARSLREQ